MLANSRRSRNTGAPTAEGSNPFGPSLSSTQVLVAGGAMAPVIFVGLSSLDSLIQPGYDLLTGYVSDLSWMSDGWMTVASFIISGWLLIGFSIALCRLADGGSAPAWAPILIGFMGFGLIAAGAFEIDPSWSRLTLHGALHYASTVVTGGSLALASFLVWRDRHRGGQARNGAVFLASGLVCVTLFAASLVLPGVAMPGLLERIALLIGAVWIAGFARAVYPQRRFARIRHEFERNGMAA